jgi:hypothetical protein
MRHYMLSACLLITMSVSFAQSASVAPRGFESPEHLLIGEQVVLQFTPDTPKTNTTLFTLANGLTLSYSQLMTLAGDFYGLPDEPIALGKDSGEQQSRFLKAYHSLAVEPKSVAEAKLILDDINLEMSELNSGIKNGENPIDIYARISIDHLVTQNCITGGFCVADHPGLPTSVIHKIFVLNQGRVLKLAKTDFDHFENFAWVSYSVGHTLALNKAIEAHATNNLNTLAEAYALNGFACHYLSDLFAAGHMRSPHYLLATLVFPATVGSVLANYMHNEDNTAGLAVTNRNGDRWVAYGDTRYLDLRNDTNREVLQRALQASADEVYQVYSTGALPTSNPVYGLIPNLDVLNNDSQHLNTSPMFVWDNSNQKLLRRTHVNDAHDYTWTSVWVGWTTALELASSAGLPHVMQAELMLHADTRDKALSLGLINDKDLIGFYHQHQTEFN